eukprot:Nk52_evm16s157 gene=Nk52_evmTU16s157
MQAFAETLQSSSIDYDVVCLQEVWVKEDYDLIAGSCTDTYPEHHYFHSGVYGSGLAILSRHPIVEIFSYRFQPNGKPYRVRHADWFGAKVIGCCRIQHPDIGVVDVHTTHLHAEYVRGSPGDEYLAHRTAQAYQAARFVNLVSGTCYNKSSKNGECDNPSKGEPGLVVLAGDMNFEPTDCAYFMYKYVGDLVDVWADGEAGQRTQRELRSSSANVSGVGDTCDCVDNPYTSEAKKKNSKRIDYIFQKHVEYGTTSRWFKCTQCDVVMKTVPGKSFAYSDHFGLEAVFELVEVANEEKLKRDMSLAPLSDSKQKKKQQQGGARKESTSSVMGTEEGRHQFQLEAMNIIDEGLDDALERRGGNIFNFYLATVLWMVFFIGTFWGFHVGMYLQYVHPPLMLVAIYYFLIGYVFGNSEVNALRQVQGEMKSSFGFGNTDGCTTESLGEDPLVWS